MEQRRQEPWPEAFWAEFEGLLTHRYPCHTKEVCVTDADTVVVVWAGPLPSSVEARLRPLVGRGDLELVRREPDVPDHLVRHLELTLRRARLARVDVAQSIEATDVEGRVVLVVTEVTGSHERLERIVRATSDDYGTSLHVRSPR